MYKTFSVCLWIATIMAESLGTFDQLEQEITCAVCLGRYEDPRFLSCDHYYCKECIRDMAFGPGVEARHRGGMTCPECRCETVITEESLEELRPAFFADRLKSTVLSTLAAVEGPSCDTHEQPLRMYCFKCSSLICNDCRLKDHKDHEFEFTSIVARDTRKKIKEKLQPLVEGVSELERTSEEIEDEVSKLECQGDTLKEATAAHFENLRAILKERELAMFAEINQIVGEKKASLLQQKGALSIAAKQVNEFVSQTNESVESCSRSEIIAKHAEILEEIESTANPKHLIYTVEEVHLQSRLDCTEPLHDLCKNNATVGLVSVDAAQCEVVLDGASQVEVGKMQEASITLKLASGSLCRSPCDVSCRLTCVRTGTENVCLVVQAERSRHAVRFMAVKRGRHKLAVLVNEVHVAGSPFSVFAVVNPMELGEPVDVINDVKQVTGIAVNSKGIVVAMEEKGDIVMYDIQKSETLTRIKPTQHRVKSAYSVAIDENDAIFCGDYSSNHVFTSTCEGGNEIVKDVPLHQKVAGRRGIAIAGDKLLMCEKDRVVVYKKDTFEFTGEISDEQMASARCVHPGDRGMLYVTDRRNSAIHVFENGKYLRSIGKNQAGEAMVPNPLGLCVFGEHLYVTDYTKSNVSIFTTSGEYVTSFGQPGSGSGHFKLPHEICCDKDGFIYVADRSNNRVQIF